jgi:osmotically inducible protein OsmC
MSVTSEASTAWKGSLTDGSGTVALNSSKIGTFDVNWKARSEGSSSTTTPEELIAAAHSSCFSMALSHGLTGAGTPPTSIDTKAEVSFQAGVGITGVHLTVRANVPGLTQEAFVEAAEGAKANCPVSKALAAVENITLDASLV